MKRKLILSKVKSFRRKGEVQLPKKHIAKPSSHSTPNGPSALSQHVTEPVKIPSQPNTDQPSKISEHDTLNLLHKLDVHRIELEIQNEEIKTAIEKAAIATALYDFAPAGYFTISNNGIISELNYSGAMLLGKKRDDLINSNFKQFVAVDDLPALDEFFRNIFETSTRQNCKVRLDIKGKPSTTVHLEGIISDDMQKCLVIAIDITDLIRAEEERMHTEKQLRESEERFRSLFDNATIGLYRTSPDGRILMANPTAVRLLGFDSFEELARRNLENEGFDSTSSRSHFRELIEKKSEVRGYESAWKRNDGSVVFVRESAKVFRNGDGTIMYYEGTIEDITERKLTEEALKESENSLRELNATKDKFFSIIAHDLKSPFNSIVGFSNLLVERIEEKNYEAVARYALIIQHSSKQAMDLLMNLLEWSRLQSGRMEFNPETIDIVALINLVTELLNHVAQQKSITIYTELPDTAKAFADIGMIGTILRNLITNAIKFTNPGGEIVVSAEQSHDGLKVTVADNGIGLNNETMAKLFRIEESNSRKGTQNEQGTGLGLVLCKEFILKHGGKIWVESETGKGSKFYFTIPVKREDGK